MKESQRADHEAIEIRMTCTTNTMRTPRVYIHREIDEKKARPTDIANTSHTTNTSPQGLATRKKEIRP